MRRTFFLIATLLLVTGCATSQKVSLGMASGVKKPSSVALAPSEGNSADVDAAIKSAFQAQGVVPKQSLPAGTRKSTDADLVVDYTDQWRWDLVMYLRWITINMYDAESGNLLASARWDNSAFHGFQDYKVVVKGLVDEILAKVGGASK